MSRKSKLVLESVYVNDGSTVSSGEFFRIVKTVNTLSHGVPGDKLTRKEVDILMKSRRTDIQRGDLTVEFINGKI